MKRSHWIPALAILLCLGAMMTATVSHAGFADALKKKVSDKLTKKASDAADKATDKSTGTPAQVAPAAGTTGDEAGEKGAPAKDTGKVSEVSSKFDFVPGDKVLFADDFTQDDLGEFPARWKLLKGTFEVAEMDGERWLRSLAIGGDVRMKLPPGLPEYWTLEFDGYNLDGSGNGITVTGLSASGQELWYMVFPQAGRFLHFQTGDVVADTPFEGSVSGRHHLAFMARGSALKVYVDRERMANAPDVTTKGVTAEIDIQQWSDRKPMLTNVRLAEGCKPAKDALDTGKLVTYGIRFQTGSDVVLPESAPVLRQVSGYMDQHPDVKLRITGHTDNVGSTASNLELSKRRAASVAKVLADQFGVAADRFATDGKGDTEALASNAKPEGRAMNRRVEFAKQ